MTPDQIAVFEDWLEDRGWQRLPRDRSYSWAQGLPDNWEFFRGGIARANVYWFIGTASIEVDYKSDRTRFHPSQDRWRPETSQEFRTYAARAEALVAHLDASEIYDPETPPGMHRPLGLSEAGNLAYDVLLQFFKDNDLTFTGGGTTFWHPRAWAENGNRYSVRAELVVVYEGGSPREAMTLDSGNYALNERMQALLRRHGLFFEEGNSYLGGVYQG